MSDEGARPWKFRPPPRSAGGPGAYKLCPNMQEDGVCRFGDQCAEAHSFEEIQEWKERLEFRQKKAKKAAKLYESLSDQIVEKLASAANVNNVSSII